MKSIRAWFARLFAVFGSDSEISAEIDSHLQLHIDDNLRAGMTPLEARRRAVIALGSIEGTKEAMRDRRGIPIVETLWRDLKYSARTLRRDAALTTFAILIIAIGIGASTTVFGVVNALWLRPLPFDDPERLVWIANGASKNLSNQTVQVGHVVDLREQSQSLTGLAGFSPFYNPGDIRLTGAGEAERVTGVPVTENFFPLLGVRPWLGRYFTDEECRWGAPRTAILSHAFWQRRLGAKAEVIGGSITLDGAPTTIVGVLPPSFDFASVFSPGRPADLFVPFPLSQETNRQGNTLALVARLKPGIDLTAAAVETTIAVDRFSKSAPSVEPGRRRNAFRPSLSPLQDRVSGRFHRMLAVLAAAVGLLMLLVSANISSLLLARASARHREVALRMALGAGRSRVIQQMLVEGLLLSCAGAALGLVLAFAGTMFVARLEGVTIPLLAGVRVDGVALVFITLVAVITGVGFGVLPALQASGLSPQDALKETSRTVIGGGWMRRAIVVTEVALVCILLAGAGLLTRSLARVLEIDPGFTSENVITLRVDPLRRERPTRETRNAYFDSVLQHVRAVPGVDAVGLTDALPLGDNFGWRSWDVEAKDRVTDPSVRPGARTRMIDDGYLPAMRIGMKAGRAFTSGDHASSERVVIINEALARAVWADADPLGRVLRTSNRDYRVVGVVNDVRYFALEQDTGPEMYMLLTQTGDYETVDLVVKSAVPAASLIPAIRAALKRADPALPAIEFRTMEQLVDRSVFTRRIVVLLLAGFAGFGLVLASLGLYAVISYSVTQRTREIGVRMALGAAPAAMQGQVLAETLRLATIGLAIGIPSAWMAAKAIQGLLFGVVSSDPATFGGVAVTVAIVAALAGYLPARRASRIDPVLALRCD
jgi:putative ABC transport system permease protein